MKNIVLIRKNIKNIFCDICSLNSIDNEKASEMYFYSFMGTLFRDTIIKFGLTNKDLRVNIMWVQSTRTGKSQLNKVYQRVCKDFGIKIVVETEFSTAGLIGSVDQDAIKHNQKYGLSVDVPSRSVGKKIVEYQEPTIKGDLGNYDVLIFDEAKLLLQNSRWTENLLSVMQPILDYPGYVRKKLSVSHAIEYNANPTIIATTYPFKRMSNVLLEQGFFQRMLLYIRDLNIDEVQEMRENTVNLIGISDVQYQDYVRQMKEQINDLPKYKEIEFTKAGMDKLTEMSRHIYRTIKDTYSGVEIQAATTFINTMVDYAIKISGIHAILMKSKKIDWLHVKQAWGGAVSAILYHTLKNLIIEDDDKQELAMKNKVLFCYRQLKEKKSGEKIAKVEFRDYLSDQRNIGKNKSLKIIDRMIGLNYFIIEQGKANTKYLLLKNT